jgi:hypothetical protein
LRRAASELAARRLRAWYGAQLKGFEEWNSLFGSFQNAEAKRAAQQQAAGE